MIYYPNSKFFLFSSADSTEQFVCALMTYQLPNDRPLFLLCFVAMQLQVTITLYVVIICEICI